MPWTPTPAASTLTTLQQVVAKYVLSPDDTEAQSLATEGLNEGVRRLNSRTWNWMLASEDVTLSASTADYVLSSNAAKKIRSVELLDSAGKVRSMIPYMDGKTFQTRYPDRSADGEPQFYTAFNLIANGTVTLSSPASAGFIGTYPHMRVWSFRRVSAYSATSDTLTTLGHAPSEVERFVVWTACAYVSARYLQGGDPKLALAIRMADDAWTQLLADDKVDADWD